MKQALNLNSYQLISKQPHPSPLKLNIKTTTSKMDEVILSTITQHLPGIFTLFVVHMVYNKWMRKKVLEGKYEKIEYIIFAFLQMLLFIVIRFQTQPSTLYAQWGLTRNDMPMYSAIEAHFEEFVRPY